MRLRHKDPKAKTKIIIDVVWRKLRGNKESYLSVDIKQVIRNGESLHFWKEQKEAIKNIDADLYTLVDNHLINESCPFCVESEINKVINLLNKYLQQKANPPIVFEDFSDLVKCRLEAINAHEVRKKSFKLVPWLEDHVNDTLLNDRNFEYKDLNKKREWVLDQHKRTTDNHFTQKKRSALIVEYFDLLVKYQKDLKVLNSYEFKRASIKRSDVLTLDTLAEKTKLDISQIKDLIFSENLHNDVDHLLRDPIESYYKNLKITLDTLTERYNINTVAG